MDSSKFKTGNEAALAIANHTYNGNSLIGNSNVFTSNHTTLNGTSPISSNGGRNDSISTTGICVPRSYLQVTNGNFNAVRSGI